MPKRALSLMYWKLTLLNKLFMFGVILICWCTQKYTKIHKCTHVLKPNTVSVLQLRMYCTDCGKKVVPTWKFCTYCGGKLEGIYTNIYFDKYKHIVNKIIVFFLLIILDLSAYSPQAGPGTYDCFMRKTLIHVKTTFK